VITQAPLIAGYALAALAIAGTAALAIIRTRKQALDRRVPPLARAVITSVVRSHLPAEDSLLLIAGSVPQPGKPRPLPEVIITWDERHAPGWQLLRLPDGTWDVASGDGAR
jgi:hypothetical protein